MNDNRFLLVASEEISNLFEAVGEFLERDRMGTRNVPRLVFFGGSDVNERGPVLNEFVSKGGVAVRQSAIKRGFSFLLATKPDSEQHKHEG